MSLRKIEPDDFQSFQAEIEISRSSVERTKLLTWFYTEARFKIAENKFLEQHHVDGSNDGGIDCIFNEGNTFYIIQSKYHERLQKESLSSITHEIQKIEKTLIGENTNKHASDFINALKRSLNDNNAYLEIIWLTTNEVPDKIKKESQKYLQEVLRCREWELNADINFIDRYALESVIYDIKHGYVPHTGKKEIVYEPGECMIIDKGRSNIEAVVINTKATEILDWFSGSQDIEKFLQKNVRESVGENAINKKIQSSFKEDPLLFWYKHNGIIIFADWLEVDQKSTKLIVRNPQIVNGAQTITQLYKVYDRDRGSNNPTKLLVRVYRLPYEDSETYKRSIDIIAALNSQNKIKASDLHSTDPRQVMLENRIDGLGTRFRYLRKRSENNRNSSQSNIKMTDLAQCYYVVSQKKPDEGISGGIESYFEEEKRYSASFPENEIKKTIKNLDHIVFKYLDSWRLKYVIDKSVKNEIPLKLKELRSFIYWYVLADCYNQLQDWKEKSFKGTWRDWIDFTTSSYFENGIIKYVKQRYKVYYDMLPKSEIDPRSFYKSTNGRNKYLKNSGNFTLFKTEINQVYQQYNKSGKH